MARTRSTSDDAGADAPATTAAENQLLRQQLGEMAGQLAALTEHVHRLTQPPAAPAEGTQAPQTVPTASMTGPSVPVSEVRVAPPLTAAVEVPLVQTGGPTETPATARGPQGGS